MKPGDVLRRLVKILLRKHGDVKSFEHELRAAGGEAGRVDTGMQVVARQKIVGSVGRWRNLRSDFFYRKGSVTERFERIGNAMRQGKALPPLELYKVARRHAAGTGPAGPSEYYVVDSHHRVAMAKKLGQDFLDAHVVQYTVAGEQKDAATPEDGRAEDQQ